MLHLFATHLHCRIVYQFILEQKKDKETSSSYRLVKQCFQSGGTCIPLDCKGTVIPPESGYLLCKCNKIITFFNNDEIKM